ncbi:MAG: hypothetical protein JEZ08_24330 [Clostridiales bacterium]|nr:hypothetical protein [Clostridiales bacterium]
MDTLKELLINTMPKYREKNEFLRYLYSEEFDILIEPMIIHFKNNAIFDDFNGKLQVHGRGSSRVEYKSLAKWLLDRSLLVGTSAVDELEAYINCKTFSAFNVLWLSNIQIDGTHKVGSKTYISSIKNLPNRKILKMLDKEGRELFDWVKPSSILMEEVVHTKNHYDQSKQSLDHFDFDLFSNSRLEVFRLLFSFHKRKSMQSIGFTTLFPDSIPDFNGISTSNGDIRNPDVVCEISGKDSIAVGKLYDSFINLSDKTQSKLIYVLRKINYYYSTYEIVERASQIRTLLEMLVLDDNPNGELVFNLSHRLARYFGEDKAERQDIVRITKKMYNIGSKAIHEGYLPEKKNQEFHECKQIIMTYIHRLVSDLLSGKQINWRDILIK